MSVHVRHTSFGMRLVSPTLLLVPLVWIASAEGVDAPTVHGEPPYTHHEQIADSWRWNWVDWDPVSGPGTIIYKVQCVIGDDPYDTPHMFTEPWATRGNYNTVFVGAGVLVEVPFSWGVTDTECSFWYPAGWESYFRFMLHNSLLSYRVMAAVDSDTLGTASGWSNLVASTQDNESPMVRDLNLPDITASTQGNVSGSVQVKDYPAAVYRVYLRYRRGQESWQVTPNLSPLGDDWYAFTIEEPSGGWGAVAGDYVTMEFIAYDYAALPDEQWPSPSSGNRMAEEYREYVEGGRGVGLPGTVSLRWPEERAESAGARGVVAEGRRGTVTFIVQVATDASFGTIIREQPVPSANGYAKWTFTGLDHNREYFYRARTATSGWSDGVHSWQDEALPNIDSTSYGTDPADLNELSSGSLHGWIQITDEPSGVREARGEYQRVGIDPEPQAFYLANEGGNTWGFYVPEPPGGWAAMAWQPLTIQIWASDWAAPHDGWAPDGQESWWPAPPDTVEIVHPQVTLLVPNGGETWSGAQTITWTATDPDGPSGELVIALLYARQSQLPDWTPIASGLPNTGSYEWNTTEISLDASDYLVRIRATDADQFWSEDTSDAPFTIDNHVPVAEVIAPDGGEWWFGTREVRWYAADAMAAPEEVVLVDIGFKQDFDPFWNVLVTDLVVPSYGDTGSFWWDTDQVAEGDQYRVRAVVQDGVGHVASDVSDGTFVINREDPPEVEVVYPNGGEILGGTVVIRWSASDPDVGYGDRVYADVEYSPDGGTQWIGLQYGVFDTDSLEWDTTNVSDGSEYLIRVRGTDIHGWSTEDVSDGLFTIFNYDTAPDVVLLYPNGGEQLEGVVEVQWEAWDPDSLLGDSLLVDLEASPDSGETWLELVSDTQDDGAWSWNTTQMEDSPFYLLRITVTDIRDSSATDLSDSLFSIFNVNHAPAVQLLEPVGGEYWWGVRDITWSAWDPDSLLGDTLVVSLWYSPDAGWQWISLVEEMPNAGVWSWNTTTVPDDSLYMVKIRAADIAGEFTVDYSDTTFVINQNEGPTLQLLAPIGGEIWNGEQYVQWSAQDPDLPFGDTLAVGLYVSDDAGGSWLPLSLGLRNTGSWLWDTRSYADGLSYAVRAVVSDTAGLWTEDSSGIFSIENYNLPPEPFHLVQPESAEVITVLRPEFLWTTAVDIDAGDRIHYTVVCDTTLEFATAWSWQARLDTSLVAPEALNDNTVHYWKVLAIDSLGPDTTTSSEQGWWFVTNLGGLNDPPQDFSLLEPVPGEIVSTLTPKFLWSSSWDPDPLDWIEYTLYVDTLSDFSTALVEPVGQDTSLVPGTSLVDNRTYYWKVAAVDPHGAITWAMEGVWYFYTDTVNDLPAAFSLLRPESASVETQLVPLLLWTASSDPDPVDSLWYQVWLDTLPDFTTNLSFTSTDTSTTPPWMLTDNATWYWKAAALDSRGDTTRSREQGWWFFTNSVNDPPYEFNLLEPESATVITGATPTFRWEEALDLDPLDEVTYTLWYDKHSDFRTYREVTSITGPQHTLSSPMRERGTVYWKVKATDRAGESVWSRQKDWWFVVPPQELVEGFINYPNPFDPDQERTTLQYVLLRDARVTIRVFDLVGNQVVTLSYAEGEDGGRTGTNRVFWDGENSRDNVVGNGGYLCLLEARFADGTTVEKHRKVAVLR